MKWSAQGKGQSQGLNPHLSDSKTYILFSTHCQASRVWKIGCIFSVPVLFAGGSPDLAVWHCTDRGAQVCHQGARGLGSEETRQRWPPAVRTKLIWNVQIRSLRVPGMRKLVEMALWARDQRGRQGLPGTALCRTRDRPGRACSHAGV